ncbi:phosphatidic acid phosphatase, putative [Leishmania tarentolae]|uniref:Phosphatidic acid phosphatase, putative n=1 Tax=Leishmania tarentolae TaxID=5689 RepID=A0A640KDT9_LEITA|nr:phosphatidic acid phosphatase, putative [Leishmania tarentolae]
MPSCTAKAVWCFILFFRLHDYLLCLICGFAALGISKVRPHCRPFSWTDPSISFPYAGAGTFPSWTLPIISILPGVVYILGEAARQFWPWHRRSMIMSRELCSEHKWPMMEDQRDGGATQDADVGHGGCDAASSLTFPSQSVHLPLSADRQGKIEVLVNRTPSFTSLDMNMREVQAGPQLGITASASRQLGSSGIPIINTHGGHTGSRESAAIADAVPSSAAGSVLCKPKVPYALAHPWQLFLFHAHIWCLTQAFSVIFAMLLVDLIKVYAGRLRPDFLSRLRREGYTPQSTEVDWCAVPKGGRVSFPSGHSSISFAAFVPFCFYALHSLRVFRRGGVSLWRILIGLTPLLLPIFMAVSRTRDNRHYFDDIVTGSAIGIASAVITVKATMTVDDRTGRLVPQLLYRERSNARGHQDED